MSFTSQHKEIHRKIIHVDMDAFYASVEQRDFPQLRGKPVIVGGLPNGRGVVAACSYEARVFGIHSAMPSVEAGRRCPDAVFVKPRFSDYQMVSSQIQEIFRSFTSLVEPLSLDEAYLDVTGSDLFSGSALLLAQEIRKAIHERTALVASAGVSYNKFLAKIASDFDKPDGLYCIRPNEGEAFVEQLPIGKFHGVGRVTEARMKELGIHTGGDLKAWPLAELEREFGKSSAYFYKASRGIDHRPVCSSRTRRSMGNERTFSENLVSTESMLEVLESLGSELLTSLAEKRLTASTVSVKLRFGDFETLTRAYSHPPGDIDHCVLARALPVLLSKALAIDNRHGVRLLGVAFSSLADIDDQAPKQMEFRAF